MSRRRTVALCAAAIAIALVVAQVIEPGRALYHSWQYALVLALALVVTIPYATRARRGADGAIGRALLLSLLGAAIVGVAGLAAGLLGPDTALVSGTPGSVQPIPALAAAGFFSSADPASIARGDGSLVLRRRGAAEIVLAPGAHRMLGESMLALVPQPAAYVDAFDARGNHLTITQPDDPGFLSPVLLFHERQRIRDRDLPLDTFATPAKHRIFRALALTPAELAMFRGGTAPAQNTKPVIVVTAADDAQRPLGIAMVQSDAPVAFGGVSLHLTSGTYPALEIAAIPPLWALLIGGVLFAAGIVLAGRAAPRDVTAAAPPPAAELPAG